MRILITGATGLIGSFLAEELIKKGEQVHLITRKEENMFPSAKKHVGDVTDKKFIEDTIKKVRPDLIFHLAAQSFPVKSWQEPEKTIEVNVQGTIIILEAMRTLSPKSRVLLACSSAEYTRSNNPISENDKLQPTDPYGLSKLAVDHLGEMYHKQYGLDVVRCRPFFLIGPRKEGDVSSHLAKGILAVENKEARYLSVGNLENTRDFLDIRDGIQALQVIAKKGRSGEVYNICSGKGHKIQELLDLLKKESTVKIQEKVSSNLIRDKDDPVRVGDPKKLMSLGWKPKIALEQTMHDIMMYWRERVKEENVQVVILTGGLGTRIRSIGGDLPKALVPVLKKPFIDYQLKLLAKNRLTNILLCVGYGADKIKAHVGDGSKFGVRVTYVKEDPTKLLGTGGALVNALLYLEEIFFITYGDAYLTVDYQEVAKAFLNAKTDALMCVFKNDGKWDTSNTRIKGNKVIFYSKKAKPEEVDHIDYGLSIYKKSAIEKYKESSMPLDLAKIQEELVQEGNMAAFVVKERFYEMGKPEGLKEMEEYFKENNL